MVNAEQSTEQSPVLAVHSTHESQPLDADEALRVAIKAAVDAGQIERAQALLALLAGAPKPATVVDIRRVK